MSASPPNIPAQGPHCAKMEALVTIGAVERQVLKQRQRRRAFSLASCSTDRSPITAPRSTAKAERTCSALRSPRQEPHSVLPSMATCPGSVSPSAWCPSARDSASASSEAKNSDRSHGRTPCRTRPQTPSAPRAPNDAPNERTHEDRSLLAASPQARYLGSSAAHFGDPAGPGDPERCPEPPTKSLLLKAPPPSIR